MSNSQNINLIFIFQGNSYSIQCQENDKLNAIFLRFATKAQIDIKDLIFIIMQKKFLHVIKLCLIFK